MKKIMVVKQETLFAKKHFDGFISASEFDFESVILKNFEWMDKEQAEADPAYKQPIGYSIIYNPTSRKVFFYQRSKIDKNYAEKRLQEKWSCGVGGHIEKVDTRKGNPIHESVLREIQEEIEITGKKHMQVLGYINDDSNDVGKVHFGILYLVIIDSDTVKPLYPEISEGRLVPIHVLENKCKSTDVVVENWTKIALEPLKNIQTQSFNEGKKEK